MSISPSVNGNNCPSNQEVVDNMELVVKIAKYMYKKIPCVFSIDELIQIGAEGLLEAEKKFNPSQGASFSTYASIKIKGKILDEVRRNTWIPRTHFQNLRTIDAAKRRLCSKNNYCPRPKDVAKELNVSLGEYYDMCNHLSCRNISYSEDIETKDNLPSLFESNNNLNPLYESEFDESLNILATLIDNLSDRDKKVLELRDIQGYKLKKIGQILGVSESRVCQIYSNVRHKIVSHIVQ